MKKSEKTRVESLSNWYIEEQLDFDKRLIRYRYLTLKERIKGESCLELGCADGQMTQFLVDDFKELTVVDGAKDLLDMIPDRDNLIKIHSLFEDFSPDKQYDFIILEHVLEHVDDPVALIRRLKNWLSPGGQCFLGVPNGHSIHRLAATKMGMLDHPCQLNERDLGLGHRRVYTPETFRKDIEKSGLIIEELGGVYFKPVSNGQIENEWSEAMMDGFYELGKDFPEHAAEIYALCNKS